MISEDLIFETKGGMDFHSKLFFPIKSSLCHTGVVQAFSLSYSLTTSSYSHCLQLHDHLRYQILDYNLHPYCWLKSLKIPLPILNQKLYHSQKQFICTNNWPITFRHGFALNLLWKHMFYQNKKTATEYKINQQCNTNFEQLLPE